MRVAFLTDSQLVVMLLVQELHIDQQGYRLYILYVLYVYHYMYSYHVEIVLKTITETIQQI